MDNPLAISREMEKQITSNNIRIAMLEDQNKKLRHSIQKLSEISEDVKPQRQVTYRSCLSPFSDLTELLKEQFRTDRAIWFS